MICPAPGAQRSNVGMLPPSDSDEDEEEGGEEKPKAKAASSSKGGQSKNAGMQPSDEAGKAVAGCGAAAAALPCQPIERSCECQVLKAGCHRGRSGIYKTHWWVQTLQWPKQCTMRYAQQQCYGCSAGKLPPSDSEEEDDDDSEEESSEEPLNEYLAAAPRKK